MQAEHLNETVDAIRAAMEHSAALQVALPVRVLAGPAWGALEPLAACDHVRATLEPLRGDDSDAET